MRLPWGQIEPIGTSYYPVPEDKDGYPREGLIGEYYVNTGQECN